MKKLRICALSAALCLLTGCGNAPEPASSSEASSADTTDTPAEVITEAPEIAG